MGVIAGVITVSPPTGPAIPIPPRILRQATTATALPPRLLQAYLDDAIATGSGGGIIPPTVPPTPTGFAFASNITFTFVVATWDIPPAGVVSTELWTSTDNITFNLAQTLGAPTATANVAIPAIGSSIYAKIRAINGAGNSAFTSVLQFTHTDWETRANTNSGVAILAASKAVQNNLYSALANASILSKMINVGFFENASGNHVAICLTPIIHTTGGNAWTNSSMGDGMVGVNGVNATGGPGVGARPGLAGTDFPSDSNGGLTLYAFTGAEVLNAYAAGYTNNLGTVALAIQIQTGGNVRAKMWNDTSLISLASPGAGYYSLNRTGAAALNLYYAKVATPHASIGSSAAASGSRSANFIDFFSVNAFENIPELFTVNNTLRLIAAHQGLTAAESLAFYNAIVAAITFLGQSPV